MSVLIKGIAMPKEPWECPCHDGETGWCKVTGSSCFPIPKDCPLVEVSTSHERLIDADMRGKKMDNLISRQDIEWHDYLVADGNGMYHNEQIAYKSQVDDLPSAQPEQRWIPCSERLPKIGEHHVSEPYIVYCSNGAYGFAELEENIFGQVGWNCERDDEYHEPLGEVIAWMPLPEPYEEK